MAERPEIPEAKDRFETAVAIAVVAVMLSWISNRGDDAKTSAIIKTNEASNKWGHFQSKSIKERLISTTLDLTSSLNGGAAAGGDSATALKDNLRSKVERYRTEKDDLQKDAEQLQADAVLHMRINDRCGSGSLILQVAIVIASVAIIARLKFLWFGGILLAVVGSAIGMSSHFM